MGRDQANGKASRKHSDLRFSIDSLEQRSPSTDGVTPITGVVLTSTRSSAKIKQSKSKTFGLHFKVTSALAAGSYFPLVSVSLGGVSMTAMGTTQFTVV
jgi:hypothetical protein